MFSSFEHVKGFLSKPSNILFGGMYVCRQLLSAVLTLFSVEDVRAYIAEQQLLMHYTGE